MSCACVRVCAGCSDACSPFLFSLSFSLRLHRSVDEKYVQSQFPSDVYKVDKPVGQGAYGLVFRARTPTTNKRSKMFSVVEEDHLSKSDGPEDDDMPLVQSDFSKRLSLNLDSRPLPGSDVHAHTHSHSHSHAKTGEPREKSDCSSASSSSASAPSSPGARVRRGERVSYSSTTLEKRLAQQKVGRRRRHAASGKQPDDEEDEDTLALSCEDTRDRSVSACTAELPVARAADLPDGGRSASPTSSSSSSRRSSSRKRAERRRRNLDRELSAELPSLKSTPLHRLPPSVAIKKALHFDPHGRETDLCGCVCAHVFLNISVSFYAFLYDVYRCVYGCVSMFTCVDHPVCTVHLFL
jgi:hypothetical protein